MKQLTKRDLKVLIDLIALNYACSSCCDNLRDFCLETVINLLGMLTDDKDKKKKMIIGLDDIIQKGVADKKTPQEITQEIAAFFADIFQTKETC